MTRNIAAALFSPGRLAAWADHDALVCEGRRTSYGALADRVARAGAALREEGGRRGDRIVLRTLDTEALVTAILGAMRAGLVPVILSPRTTADDVRYVVDETAATLLIEEDALGASATPAVRLSVSDLAPRLAGIPPVAGGDDAAPPPDEAFWLYSSGTTGRMKGVVHAHNDLDPVLDYHRAVLGIGPGTRTVCTSRISFAYAMSNGFLAPLALGATVVLHPDWPTPEGTLETIAAAAPHVVFSVPSMYRAWLALPAAALAPMRDVERFVSAGEALPVPVAERWQALTGRPVLDCYGCSETCFLVFASPADRPRPGAVGFPCAGVETALCDELDRPAAPGAAGRLFIRHPFLARGYGPNAPAEAKARFAGGWFATGDVFRRDGDGYWHHCGREDDWLKIAGQWVSLRGVEEVAGECPGVAEAVAVTANDANGFLRVALFVVPDGAVAANGITGRIEALLGERLPAFKRPKWIRARDDLPRTTTGKVRKAELRRIIEEEQVR